MAGFYTLFLCIEHVSLFAILFLQFAVFPKACLFFFFNVVRIIF